MLFFSKTCPRLFFPLPFHFVVSSNIQAGFFLPRASTLFLRLLLFSRAQRGNWDLFLQRRVFPFPALLLLWTTYFHFSIFPLFFFFCPRVNGAPFPKRRVHDSFFPVALFVSRGRNDGGVLFLVSAPLFSFDQSGKRFFFFFLLPTFPIFAQRGQFIGLWSHADIDRAIPSCPLSTMFRFFFSPPIAFRLFLVPRNSPMPLVFSQGGVFFPRQTCGRSLPFAAIFPVQNASP